MFYFFLSGVFNKIIKSSLDILNGRKRTLHTLDTIQKMHVEQTQYNSDHSDF
jgi:hypothetical protein